MKNTLYFGFIFGSIFALLTLLPQAQTNADDPFATLDEPSEQPSSDLVHIRVQVDYIEVSITQLNDLLFGEKPPANDVELRKQVNQLVKEGKASMFETMSCVALSGQKARSESVEEFIYPTAYSCAQLPTDGKAEKTDPKNEPQSTKAEAAVGPTPISFETRNVGSSLEIEPTLHPDHKTMNLIFSPEIVCHAGNRVWAEWKGEYGNSPIQMPILYTLRLNTCAHLADAQPMFVAAMSPKKQDGTVDFSRKLMVFVRADVITVKP